MVFRNIVRSFANNKHKGPIPCIINPKIITKMEIIVLGTGCSKCKTLEKVALEAVEKAGIDATVTKVTDLMKIMSYNVMSTPALVVDGTVVVKGRVPSVKEVMDFIGDKNYKLA